MPLKLDTIEFPNQPKLTAAFAKMKAAIEWAGNLTAVAPLQVKPGAAGPVVSLALPPRRFVKITGAGGTGGSYTAVEVHATTGGGWATTSGGWTGTAWEYNLATGIDTSGSINIEVEWVASAGEYRFLMGAC